MKRTAETKSAVARHRQSVDCHAVLAKLLKLNILTWRYKHEATGVRHIGPIAEEFADAFGVGDNPRVIAISDAVGVAYASIQALYEMIELRRAEISVLRRDLSRLKRRRKRKK